MVSPTKQAMIFLSLVVERPGMKIAREKKPCIWQVLEKWKLQREMRH